jgi:SAM-dependent methyltransferase
VSDPRVEHPLADIFQWRSENRFDLVFFGFWLSHVPRDRFADFWSVVGDALKPDGRVFFVDNRRVPGASASTDEADAQVRCLNDGRTFKIVKVHYEPAASLGRLGWTCDVLHLRHGGPCHLTGVTPRPLADLARAESSSPGGSSIPPPSDSRRRAYAGGVRYLHINHSVTE